jgi:hypothetical protein
MTIQISQEHNEYRLDGSLRCLNSATLPPICDIFGGVRAESVYHPSPTLFLVRFVLQKPAGYISDGVLYILPLNPSEMVLRTGTPTWARFYNGDEVVVMDTDAGFGQGFWEVEIDKEVLYAGGYAAMLTTRIM